MISKLILIRHADTGSYYRGRLVGATDVDADKNGLNDLKRLKSTLDKFSVATVYCSPLARARQTVERLQSLSSRFKEIFFDERLREIDFGDWEMRNFQEIAKEYPEKLDSWARYTGFEFPGGESVASFVNRISQILAEFKNMDRENIVVVTHGGVIRTIICLALGIDVRHYLLFEILAGSLTILDMYEDGALLSGLNL